MPAIHFRRTVDAPPESVYEALATQEGLAGNWTDQICRVVVPAVAGSNPVAHLLQAARGHRRLPRAGWCRSRTALHGSASHGDSVPTGRRSNNRTAASRNGRCAAGWPPRAFRSAIHPCTSVPHAAETAFETEESTWLRLSPVARF